MTAPDLKPCPNCTSTLGPFAGTPDGPRQVICSTCGMRGPYQNSAISAEDKWNALARTTPLADALAVEAVKAFGEFDALPVQMKRPDVFELRVRRPLLAALRAIGEGKA